MLERGKKSPTLRTVGAICGYLEITLSDLTELMSRFGYKQALQSRQSPDR